MSDDYFKGIRYFNKLSGGSEGFVVYGGTDPQNRSEATVLGWKDSGKIFSWQCFFLTNFELAGIPIVVTKVTQKVFIFQTGEKERLILGAVVGIRILPAFSESIAGGCVSGADRIGGGVDWGDGERVIDRGEARLHSEVPTKLTIPP